MSKASEIVCNALLQRDKAEVIVGGKEYTIPAPTIHRIAGAALWLSEFDNMTTPQAIIGKLKNISSACRALSWFIQGDEKLAGELMHGTLHEICVALNQAIRLLSIQDFSMLSASARSVARLAANAKP